MSGGPDLYAVLGVPRTATDDELKAAWRRRSRLTHSDQGGDDLAFRAVQRAYEILSDPGLRAGYDAELGPAEKHPPAGPSTSAPGPGPSRPPRPDPGPRPPRPDPPRPRDPRRIDFGQIRWSAAFVGGDGSALMDPAQARIIPGRLWWLWKPVSWALIAVWALLGTWIAAERLSGPYGPGALAWSLIWPVAGVIVTVHAAKGRWSALLVACAALAWPAYTAPGELWSWAVYAWLAGAAAVPPLRARVGRPAWPVSAAAAGSVFGLPGWHANRSGAVVDRLTVIPGVRVLHQVAGAEHAIVLDRKVALVGGPAVTALGAYPTRTWPTAIDSDPQRALDDIGRWLLTDSDPMVVDRRTLAAVARPPRSRRSSRRL